VRARYYVTPGCRLQALASYGTLSGFGETANTWNFTAGVEHQFRSSPFSTYLNYRHQQVDVPSVAGFSSNGVVAGFKWAFGGDHKTLLDRDHASASLDPFGENLLFE
jgi:hypothetical protein